MAYFFVMIINLQENLFPFFINKSFPSPMSSRYEPPVGSCNDWLTLSSSLRQAVRNEPTTEVSRQHRMTTLPYMEMLLPNEYWLACQACCQFAYMECLNLNMAGSQGCLWPITTSGLAVSSLNEDVCTMCQLTHPMVAFTLFGFQKETLTFTRSGQFWYVDKQLNIEQRFTKSSIFIIS